jgi:hypothetical protein
MTRKGRVRHHGVVEAHASRWCALVLGSLATLGCYDGLGDGETEGDTDGTSAASVIPGEDTTSASGTTAGSSESGSSTSSGGSTSTSDGSSSSDGTDPTDATSGETAASDSEGSTGENDLPDEIPPEAIELVELINAYRMDNGLPAITHCPSLALVAQTHCVDLADEGPHLASGCNLHSWSDAGSWTACCYTADHAQAQCMWDKPRELTVYTGNGYEISTTAAGSPGAALASWQSSPPHNDVILNQGIWADNPWLCIGAGMYGGFAHVWFGRESDPGQN